MKQYNFIYCIDKDIKDILLVKGYKMIRQTKIDNNHVFIFVYKPEIKFDITDKTKYFISNTMRF